MLEHNRILLEEISEQDVDGLYKCYSHQETMEFFGHKTINNLEEALDIIKKNQKMKEFNTGVRYVAKMKDTKEFVGVVTLKRYNRTHHRGEIDYIILPRLQGKGFASEMLHLFLEKVFKEWNLERITAYVDLDNVRSYHLLEKLHFQKEGLLRSWVYDNGSYYDVYSFSLIRSDL
ncbi:GNAT family protein [Gracilibacillus sp. S3-1-1]|uniref:GNAT family protein n=1 Tax=Gracilibacillus pellucidus TaxID=3095368 RepID=A0ACC6M806_9BACI|nr:GNAT family protein [Gracilibacillus sp. S3-1-1]MDX8047033.1 GNAT family protein [Gracilibacillus sp. S3-1-1]